MDVMLLLNFTSVREVQFMNRLASMDVTVSGIVTEVSAVPWNALLSKDVRLFPRVTNPSPEHW